MKLNKKASIEGIIFLVIVISIVAVAVITGITDRLENKELMNEQCQKEKGHDMTEYRKPFLYTAYKFKCGDKQVFISNFTTCHLDEWDDTTCTKIKLGDPNNV